MKSRILLLVSLLFCLMANEVKAQDEWSVSWYNSSNDGETETSGNYDNIVKITNTDGFELWVAITGSNNDNGIIINNNYTYTKVLHYYTYTERTNHRPTAATELVIPSTIEVDGLGTVTITEIAAGVFYNTFSADSYDIIDDGSSLNDNISSITIPSTITTIGGDALNFDIEEGATITCLATTPPTIKESTFNEASYNRTLVVPTGTEDAYKAADYWTNFFTNVVTEDPITLFASTTSIVANGTDAVTFTVMQGEGTGTDVTSDCEIYVNGSKIDGYSFSTSTAGEYKVYAMKGTLQSYEIIITATEYQEPIELTVDNGYIFPNGTDAVTFTVTQGTNDVTADAKIFINGEEINGATSSSTEEGLYTAYATKDDMTTEEIIIVVNEWKNKGFLKSASGYNYSTYTNGGGIVEIYNETGFVLWVGMTGTYYKDGTILNNNYNYEYNSSTYIETLTVKDDHRPTVATDLIIPDTIYVTAMDEYYGNITIRHIGDNVFCNTFDGSSDFGCPLNDNITSITIPSTIESIGYKAFDFAFIEGFTITCQAEVPPTIQNSTFGRDIVAGGVNNNTADNYRRTLYVPSTSVDAYKTAEYWIKFFETDGGSIEADPNSTPTFIGSGDWTTASNWNTNSVPADDSEVIIEGNAEITTDVIVKVITINEGYDVTVKDGGFFYISSDVTTHDDGIIIDDGGQFQYDPTMEESLSESIPTDFKVTLKKDIKGYGDDDNTSNGWYTISLPVFDTYNADSYYHQKNIEDITNLIPTSDDRNYDLYRYFEYGDGEIGWWENYKKGDDQMNVDIIGEDFTTLDQGRGYLYASSEDVTIEFKGNLEMKDITHYCLLFDHATSEFNGFNLIGNPFTHNIMMANITGTEQEVIFAEGFFTITNDGVWYVHTSDEEIEPCQGFLVQVEEQGGETAFITFTKDITRDRGNKKGAIAINVSNEKYDDVAYISFSDGHGINKYPHHNKEAHKVYIPVEGENYAIATMNDDVKQVPVNFEAMTMGQYTISAKAKDCKLNTMTLIDRMTGIETNLLTDSYTFMAMSGDKPERFVMKLEADANGEADADFIYINNNEMIINNIEGEGLVFIYDVIGRPIAKYDVSGSANINIETLAQGVYIVRMSDGNGVKTQKIVKH